MSSPSELPLFGFVNPSQRLPAFLVPIFGNIAELWIQDGTGDGLLSQFSECTVPLELIATDQIPKLSVKVGDGLIYAFQFPNNPVQIGSKATIQKLLSERLEEFQELPFLLIDILKFIGRRKAIAGAIQKAKSKLVVRNPEIAEKWSELMGTIYGSESDPRIPVPDHKANLDQPGSAIPLFRMGDLVALRSNPTVIVPIIEVIPGAAEFRYRVFQNNTKATYYESQLQGPPAPVLDRTTVNAYDLQAYITSLQILSPSTTTLFSLRAGRVQFVPYQYRPVLKLIRSDRPRLLIADEVGVGKTIEAGLVIKELRARTDLTSVLIICPKALVAERKWFVEMKRFDESFVSLDGPLLRHCLRETYLEEEWPQQYAKAILPFSLFDTELLFGRNGDSSRQEKGLLSLDPPPKFDLVIVDEAHHIRNSDTMLHQGVRYFCDNANAVLFLSATPVQLSSNDLFVMLNALRPDLVIDRASFDQMAAPNQYVNAAIQHSRGAREGWRHAAQTSLIEAGDTGWGRLFMRKAPVFQQVLERLSVSSVSDRERVGIVRDLEELYTFSPLINRTRRRDIGEFTVRKPETITIEFTPAQQEIHDGLLEIISRILAFCHGQQNVKFMMTTIRRQAASCLFGLSPLLRDILGGKIDQIELMESSDMDEEVDVSFIPRVRADIDELIEKTRKLDPDDPKVNAYLRVLRDKNALPNNKILVFSTFRHTLDYLLRHTERTGIRCGMIHGSIPDEERASLRRRFSLPKEDPAALDVLLSSEVGCEGLDFQFCNLLINYDLPWNPMRIEQRIGRIDRYGQKSETVAIINFVTPGTVDADIYERCLLRIGVFQHSIGGNEEILGEITRQLHDISDSFELTPEERQKKLLQLADNKVRLLQEEQELESRQVELFGLSVPNQQWQKDIEAAESRWLSPTSIQRCVVSYLSGRLESGGDHLLGEKPLKTLRLSQDARSKLLDDYKRLPRSLDPISRDWEKWLKGGQPTVAVSFDQATAAENPKVAYLTVVHPLVRQAARFLQREEPIYASLMVQSNEVPPGNYTFAVFRWKKHGVKLDELLVAVASAQSVENALLSLLQEANDSEKTVLPSRAELEEIDAQHHSKWMAAQAEHIAENRQQVEHRVQSLKVSHQARCSAIEAQITRASDERIRIMKQSELARASADFSRHMDELQQAASSGDIHATAVIFGSLNVKQGGAN